MTKWMSQYLFRQQKTKSDVSNCSLSRLDLASMMVLFTYFLTIFWQICLDLKLGCDWVILAESGIKCYLSWWLPPCKTPNILINSFQRWWGSKNPWIWLEKSILGYNVWILIFPDMKILQEVAAPIVVISVKFND